MCLEVATPLRWSRRIEPRREGSQGTRIAAPVKMFGLIVDGLITIERGRKFENQGLPVTARRFVLISRFIDLRLMKKSEIAKDVPRREKWGEFRHGCARLVILDEGARMQVAQLITVIKITMTLRGSIEDLQEIAPTPGSFQRAKLITPLLDRPEGDGGWSGTLFSRGSAEVAMAAQSLPRQNNGQDCCQ